MLCLPYAKKKLTFLFWVLLLPVLNRDLASHKNHPHKYCGYCQIVSWIFSNKFLTTCLCCRGLEEDCVEGLGDEKEMDKV